MERVRFELTCLAKGFYKPPLSAAQAPLRVYYNPNNNKNAIIKPERAIASTNAKPKIVYVNKVFNKRGLREIAIKNGPETFPIPTPAPIREIVANPAAIIFADNKIIELLK